MARRWMSSVLVAVIGLCVLAWPAGRVGLQYVQQSGRTECRVCISQGAFGAVLRPLPPPRPLDRDRFTVSAGHGFLNSPPGLLPTIRRSGTETGVMVPVPSMVAVCVGLLAVIQVPAALRRRTRKRRGWCLACGYERAGDEAACAECGRTPMLAAERSRPRPGVVVRDAGVLVFAVLLAVAGWGWTTVEREERTAAAHRAQVLDYSWYLDATQPRLTGAVAVAHPGAGPGSLESVLKVAAPGTTVVLIPGVYDLGDQYRTRNRGRVASLKDVWILGSGPDTTTLSLQLESAERVRIDGVTIECNDDPFLNLRAGGTAQLRDCLVRGYNSGAGGSNSIFAVGAVLLVEGCEFDGKSGRASGSHRGNAMDLRGEDRVFIRGTAFNYNSEIFRSSAGVIDRCTVVSEGPRVTQPPAGNELYVRGTQFTSQRTGAGGHLLREALDDPAVLARLLSAERPRKSDWADPAAFEAAAALRLRQGNAMWERLLVHPSAEVRAMARERVQPPPLKIPVLPVAEALAKLDELVLAPAVTVSLLRGGPEVRGRLEQLRDGGTEQERGNASALLRLMRAEPGLLELLEREGLRRGE